jgi:hypothetical protein
MPHMFRVEQSTEPLRGSGQAGCLEGKEIPSNQNTFPFPNGFLMEADVIPYRTTKSPVLRDRIGRGRRLTAEQHRQPDLTL